MEITNAVIIYFTLGVPFGVLSVYIRKSRLDGFDLIRVIYHLAFWPLIASFQFIARLRLHSTPPAPMDPARAGEKAECRRLRAQSAIVNGLKQALTESTSATELSLPFAECIDHPNPDLAAKCLHRRNIQLLKLHISKAEDDYSSLLREQYPGKRQDDRLNDAVRTRDDAVVELC